MAGLTPSQTIGPFFAVAFGTHRDDPAAIVVSGPRIRIEGRVLDGVGRPVADALVETWQQRCGFRRCGTDQNGCYSIETVKPQRSPEDPEREAFSRAMQEAPHLAVGVFARGILTRLLTRIYFANEPSNADDAILALVPAERRQTLLATPVATDRYAFDIVLQGERETVFFDV